jgi:hypothetical protein
MPPSIDEARAAVQRGLDRIPDSVGAAPTAPQLRRKSIREVQAFAGPKNRCRSQQLGVDVATGRVHHREPGAWMSTRPITARPGGLGQRPSLGVGPGAGGCDGLRRRTNRNSATPALEGIRSGNRVGT